MSPAKKFNFISSSEITESNQAVVVHVDRYSDIVLISLKGNLS